MKAIKLLLAAGLLAGATTLALAGPGTDYWMSRQKQQKERANVKSEVKVQVCNSVCGCAEMKK